ncbi:MAG: hypothetical protein ABIL06_01955 [Pseudomonadota bacterium]
MIACQGVVARIASASREETGLFSILRLRRGPTTFSDQHVGNSLKGSIRYRGLPRIILLGA